MKPIYKSRHEERNETFEKSLNASDARFTGGDSVSYHMNKALAKIKETSDFDKCLGSESGVTEQDVNLGIIITVASAAHRIGKGQRRTFAPIRITRSLLFAQNSQQELRKSLNNSALRLLGKF